jgi:hypothetical protein
VHWRSVQGWECGTNYPGARSLRALVAALLKSGGFTLGEEISEAAALWAAALRQAPRLRTPFDSTWFANLLLAKPRSYEASLDARRQSWLADDIPEVAGFQGRALELEILEQYLVEERCRLLALLGIGGIGKTTLAARLARHLAPRFELTHWSTLRTAPPVGDWLTTAIGAISSQQIRPPEVEAQRLELLIQLLHDRRCLLVLDNFDTVLTPGEREGGYLPGLAGYGTLLERLGETAHQSCVVLTSREAPPEVRVLEITQARVRSIELGGLGAEAGQAMLSDR